METVPAAGTVPSPTCLFYKLTQTSSGFPEPLQLLKRGGVPIVAQWLTNPTRNLEVVGLIPGLAQRVKDLVLPQAVV